MKLNVTNAELDILIDALEQHLKNQYKYMEEIKDLPPDESLDEDRFKIWFEDHLYNRLLKLKY